MTRFFPNALFRAGVLATLAGGMLAVSIPLSAQDAPAPTAPPTPPAETEKPAAERPTPAPLDLDELLRLPGSGPADRPTETGPAPDSELQRRLTGRQAQESLVQAVQEMNEVADRLAQLRDAGMVTQRLQQQIITKLDLLIKSAEDQQGRSSSSSSSQQQQSEQQPGQQDSSSSQASSPSSEAGESMPPGGQAEQLNQNLDLSVAEWGNLPERLRQSLIQGQSDYFSDMYRRWTESYYRRLAEEAAR